MAAPFGNFRMNPVRTRGPRAKSPRFSTPRQGVMPLIKRMPGSRPPQPMLGAFSSFCSVCNIMLNSEFQTREHYSGKTHINNTNMLSLASEQLIRYNAGYSSFCAVCDIKLNSAFQFREHMNGKIHQNNMSMLGSTSDQPIPNNLGFNSSDTPIKRPATDGVGPSDLKRPKLEPSISEGQEKNHLALLLEYKPDLEFVVKSQPGEDDATLFTATVEIDGQKYDASASTETLAKSSVASAVFASIGSHVEEMLKQRAAEKTDGLIPDIGKTEEPRKDPVDFTSLDDICKSVSFSCFSEDVGTFAAGVSGDAESDSKAAGCSGDDPSGNDAPAKSDVSGGDITAGCSTGCVAVPGSGDAEAASASPSLRIPKTSGAILNFIRPGTTRRSSREPSLNDPLCEECVVTITIGDETFKGRAPTNDCAKAYAAEEALVKLFGMTFERNERGIPTFTGDINEIIKARETVQKSNPSLDTDTLELVDGKNPIALLNDFFRGQATYHFLPQVSSQWGDECRCSVTIGGMTVEGQDSTKKGAKNRAALAACAALNASGMYPRLVAEMKARRVGLPIQQVLKEEERRSNNRLETVMNVAEQQPSMPMNSAARLNILFPGSKYEPQGEVVDSNGKRMIMVAVKVQEKVFTGTGSQPKYARANAAENALRSLGLWTDEDQESKRQLMALSRARAAQKYARVDASSATGYDFSRQLDEWTHQSVPLMRSRPRGQANSGQALRGRAFRGQTMRGRATGGQSLRGQSSRRVMRRAGQVTRGSGRGIVAQGQRGGTMMRGRRRAGMTATRGRGAPGGRGLGGSLAIKGSYYDTSGSAFFTGLGYGGLSNPPLGTNRQVNVVGHKPRGSPGGSSSINANLMKMAEDPSYDISDGGYNVTSNEAINAGYNDVATYESTYDSSSYNTPTDPYAYGTPAFYGDPSVPSDYSFPHLSQGNVNASQRPTRSRGPRASHPASSLVHHEVTSTSYTQVSNEDGTSFGVTTQVIRGTRAKPRRRDLSSRGSAGPVGQGAALQSPLPVTYGTDITPAYNYGNAYDGYEQPAVEQNYDSYSDPSTAVELYYPNDTMHYPNDAMQYPNDTMQNPNDTMHYPNDAMHYPNDTMPNPNDTMHYPNDAMQYPNDTMQYPNNMGYDASTW